MNEKIKGDGGVIGLTDNPAALQRWITAGPEVARIIDEFETLFQTSKSKVHHHQGFATQCQFAKYVKSVISTYQDIGNPLMRTARTL